MVGSIQLTRNGLRRWTQVEYQFIRDNAQRGMGFLSEQLERGAQSIYTRASRLGVHINRVMEYDPFANEADVKRWMWENRILPRLVPVGECLEWRGANKRGYGQIRFFIKEKKAIFFTHRIALEVARGLPLGHLGALHTCDNPRCCNPAHLYAGTAADNTKDMMARSRARGQFRKGTISFSGVAPWAKLTREAVIIIRSGALAPLSKKALGTRFGVSRTAIHHVLNRSTWRNVA